jgi:hypothetical protein
MSGQPAALAFEIAIPEVAGYRGSTGGTRGVIVTGRSDESGQFQACGLWPGEFRIAVGLDRASYGRTTVTIVDSDIHDVVVNAQPPVTLNAEIRLDSGQMTRETYRLSFRPLSRVAFESQPGLFERMDIEVPSEFTVSLLPSTDYQIGLGIPGSAANTYMKEVMCGGTVQRNSLSLGEIDCRLSIVIGTDAGTLDARVVDEDGENDLTSSVCVSPISAITPEEIALQGTCSSIDPETASVSMALRPDRYFAVAVPPEEAVDWIEYFRNNRGQAVRIDIGARSAVQATLKK